LAWDLSPERRKLALELGADAVFDPTDKDFIEQVKAASGG
jgi:threonine dehydrogenase-like Zn-dependent dehydrogenase